MSTTPENVPFTQAPAPTPYTGGMVVHPADGRQGHVGPAPTLVVAAKTPGIAVLLSFLWLGAGHLYAGKTTAGILFLVTDLLLVGLLMVPLVGWVLAPMIWLPLFIWAAIASSSATKEHNARYGIAHL